MKIMLLNLSLLLISFLYSKVKFSNNQVEFYQQKNNFKKTQAANT